MVKLREIKGAVVERKEEVKISLNTPQDQTFISGMAAGFNQALSFQGEVSLTLSRVRLAILLMEVIAKYNHHEENYLNAGTKFELMADALIAAEGEIIEVKK